MTTRTHHTSPTPRSASRRRIDFDLDEELAPVATPLEDLLADGGEFAMALWRMLVPHDVDPRGEMR